MQARRGRATAGKVAQAMAGAEAIEIKATIPEHQVDAALRRLGVQADSELKRFIYFFDTPALDLLAAGVIARARRTIGEEHDSTVKFRPVDPAKVDKRWHRYRDFKIEVDASEKGMVKSASFSMPVPRGLIKRVAAGDKPVKALFTSEQLDYLKSMARKIDDAGVVVLGPVMAQRWRVEDPACPWPITGELWRRTDGQRLLEVSIKAPAVQAAAAIGGFMAYLAEAGAERDANEQAKTRWALGFYAGQLKAAPPQGAPARTRRVQVKTRRTPASTRRTPASTRRAPARGPAPKP